MTNSKSFSSAIKLLVKNSKTMTIATAVENIAWVAPVYYVNIKSQFFFFSNPESRHIKETLLSGQAACSIFEESPSWQSLKGLQLSGCINTLKNPPEAAKIILLYIKKFPLVKNLFSSENVHLNDFLNKFHAKLYSFTPDLSFFMDNSIGFGSREKVNLSDIFK